MQEKLNIAVFVDYDNIEIGLKSTLRREFDVSLALDALKERGDIVAKFAYANWGRQDGATRQMAESAVQMVQRIPSPRGDKNGADINLALDALEMAFTRHHINSFAIVGGDSDFIALVEKLKQYDKQVFVVGGRGFTSNILQRNCTEFIAYENLVGGGGSADGSRAARPSRRGRPAGRGAPELHSLQEAFPNVQRALKILEDRGVAPQVGLLKSTLLQLDSTFSERDFGAASFLEFMQKMERAHLVHLRRTDRGFLVELANGESERKMPAAPEASGSSEVQVEPAAEEPPPESAPQAPSEGASLEALEVLKEGLAAANLKAPNRPLYLRQLRQALRTVDKDFDERRYGPRGVLDLLYQAQREGLARLQRDRKGILRIFPLVSAPPASTVAPAPAVEPTEPAQAGASTDFWDSTETVAGVELTSAAGELEVEEASAESEPATIEEAVMKEAPAEPVERKAQRPRALRGTGRTGARRAGSRRKAKSPPTSEPLP